MATKRKSTQCNDQENFCGRVTLKKASDMRNSMCTKQMKILFIGNSGVGKSSLVHWLRKGEFCNLPHEPTIHFTPAVMGAEFQRTNYLIELQDTAGQERYNAVFRGFYRHAHGAMVVYDITNYQSFENVKNWMFEVRKHAGLNDDIETPILLLGNKVDKNDQHIDGTKVAEDLGMNGFIRTSAKSGEGIREALKVMIGMIATRYGDQELEIPDNPSISLPATPTGTIQYPQGTNQPAAASPEKKNCGCA